MAGFGIEFVWWRDTLGFEFIPAQPAVAGRKDLHQGFDFGATTASAPERLIRRGGGLVPYRPLEEIDHLHVIFSKRAINNTGLLDFVQAFGPLTEPGLGINRNIDGDMVNECLTHAQTMRELVDMDLEARRRYIQRIGHDGLSWSRISVRMSIDIGTGKPKLSLVPPNLLSALWLSLGQSIINESTIRECPQCGEWFHVGPGTGRREDAKYCSDDHRIRHHSLKRSQKGANHA